MHSTVTKLAGSVTKNVTKNVTKLSFASVRMCDYKRLGVYNFVRLLSSHDPNHQRGFATSITVTMSAVPSHTPNVTLTRCRTVAVHRC